MPRQRIAGSYTATTAAILIALSLGGCGGSSMSLSDLDPAGLFSSSGPSSTPGADGGFTVKRGTTLQPVLRAVTPSDLVGADGQCQAAPAEGAAAPRGVSLTMTECEVVASAGVPEQTNIGASAGGERRVVLTYTKGDHPGIYTFVSGRLKIIERLPTATKPQPRRRAPKKKAA